MEQEVKYWYSVIGCTISDEFYNITICIKTSKYLCVSAECEGNHLRAVQM